MTTLTLATRAARADVKVHAASAHFDRPLRVLCATDLWARSDHAVQRALSLAEAAEAQTMLLHVVDDEAPLRILGRRADHAHGALQWRVRQWRGLDAAPAISVRIGKPHRMIARVAQDWRADLIVLGAYRPRTADRWVGTTAERLALATQRAVLVVNGEARESYRQATLAARSVAGAAALDRSLSELQIVQATPRRRTVLYGRDALQGGDRASTKGAPSGGLRVEVRTTRFQGAVDALLDSAPELIAVGVEQRPMVARLMARSMTNALIRSAACDVLIAPLRAQGASRRPSPALRATSDEHENMSVADYRMHASGGERPG